MSPQKKKMKLLMEEREKTGDLEKRLSLQIERLQEKLDPALEKLKKIIPTLPCVKKPS